VAMLRSHHHLRGFVKLVLWDVYCVNGYGSFRLGRCRVCRKLWLQVLYLSCRGWFLWVWLWVRWHPKQVEWFCSKYKSA